MNDPIGWTAIAGAAAIWVGVAGGADQRMLWGLLPLALLAFVIRGPGLVAVVCLGAGLLAGWSQADADAAVRTALDGDPGGRTTMEGRLVTDGRPRPPPASGWYARLDPELRDGLEWDGPPLLLSVVEEGALPAGSEVVVRGLLRTVPAEVGGRPVAGVIEGEVQVWERPRGLLGVAEWIRDRVRSTIRSGTSPPASELLIGFLMGDITELDPLVEKDLRDSGLAHYVAVSGSNVALFLGVWWLLTLPLATRPKVRWLLGIGGLVLFVAITRWESSVVRASAMAALALATRRFGIVLTGKGLLGLGVGGTLLIFPAFAWSLGFQLSVAATFGLMLGATSGGTWAGRALRATVAAQLAVAPLLLVHFGDVPLLSPLANLLAGPLVGAATVVGMAASVLGIGWLAWPAGVLADIVIRIGEWAAPLPKVGWAGVGLAAVVAAVSRMRRTRPVLGVLAVVGLGSALVWPAPVVGPAVVFLDVGQGDAALVLGEHGETVLVDGGPDPEVLGDALHRYRVDRIDLLVISHRHADHVTGLSAVIGRLPVGLAWHPDHRDLGALEPVLSDLDEAGVRRETPIPGTSVSVGSLALEVLGPLRRYASPNDESLVVRFGVSGTSVLFSGDIETFAQADLGPVAADVLKVPHQGGATSDPDWLGASAGKLAVISVGPNDFGHPADWVVEVLEEAGSLVCRTDRDGDVIVVPGQSEPC